MNSRTGAITSRCSLRRGSLCSYKQVIFYCKNIFETSQKVIDQCIRTSGLKQRRENAAWKRGVKPRSEIAEWKLPARRRWHPSLSSETLLLKHRLRQVFPWQELNITGWWYSRWQIWPFITNPNPAVHPMINNEIIFRFISTRYSTT